MRNLKKVLALVLALVMSLSLVTIANATDFSDNADIDYEEAVDVMVAAGIIDGVGNNSFDPNGTITREQAAKLITYMLMGENSDKLGVESTRFKDVAATRWSAPAIEYCATVGIIDGAGDGNFYPAGKLTGYAFAKMLLTALGYKSDREGFTGNNWTINVATKAISEDVRLDKGLEKMFGSAELSRQEAAQMALNAIKAPLVEYDNDNTISVNGATVQINGGTAKFVTTTIAKTNTISSRTLTNAGINQTNTGFLVEFGERYLTKLELDPVYDAFGRPSNKWTYDKKEVGTYIDTDLFYQEYTTEVTGRDLYDLLGTTIVGDNTEYRFNITVDGEDTYNAVNGPSGVNTVFNRTQMNKNNKAAVGGTGNGVLTQVFVDSDAKRVDIAIINTYLAKATSDYNDKRDLVSFDVYGIAGVTSGNDAWYWKDTTVEKTNINASGEDFDVKDVKEDDIFWVNVAEGDIQVLSEVEVVANSTISAFKLDDHVVVDGTTYEYASAAKYDVEVLEDWTGNNGASNLKDKTYNIYLDQYGYLLGVDLVTGTDNYVFITGIDSKTSNLTAKNYDANAIFLDGTMETITFDTEKSDIAANRAGTDFSLHNQWYTYSVNNKGIYTLTKVRDYTGATSAVGTGTGSSKIKVGQYHDTAVASGTDKIDVKNVSLQGSNAPAEQYYKVYGNDDTVYLNVAVKAIDVVGDNVAGSYRGVVNKVANTVVGIKNANMAVLTEANAAQQARDNVNPKLTGTHADSNVAYGAYVLYKDNGYVIAAVTVADDSESAKNLVYTSKNGIKLESYDKEADEWTWTRDVIQNGEEVTLTEKGDGLSYLKSMQKYNWYEVKFNAKNEVISVKHAMDALDDTTPADDAYEDNITNLTTTINSGKDTILFENAEYFGLTNAAPNGCPDYDAEPDTTFGDPHTDGSLTNAAGPNLKAHTFYTVTTNPTGVYVDDDVKVVFIQTVDNKETVSIDKGVSSLDYAIKRLNKDSSNLYHYEVSMIIDRGHATVVVIRDLNAIGNNGGYVSSTITGVDATYKVNGDVEIQILGTGTTPAGATVDIELMKAYGADLDKGTPVALVTPIHYTAPQSLPHTETIAKGDWNKATSDSYYYAKVTVTLGGKSTVYESNLFFASGS